MHRDDELVVNRITEEIPTTLRGFKGHPLCAASVSCFISKFTCGLTTLSMFWNALTARPDHLTKAPEFGTFPGGAVYSLREVL